MEVEKSFFQFQKHFKDLQSQIHFRVWGVSAHHGEMVSLVAVPSNSIQTAARGCGDDNTSAE